MASNVSNLLAYSARFVDKAEKVHKYLRQALACANKCLEGVLPSDEYYEGFCDMTVFSLQKLVAYGGAYIKAIEPKEDPVAASLLVKATEQAVALLPNPTNIVAMAKARQKIDPDPFGAAGARLVAVIHPRTPR